MTDLQTFVKPTYDGLADLLDAVDTGREPAVSGRPGPRAS